MYAPGELTKQALSMMDDKTLFDQLGRATGRTIRLCDELVQKFFNAPYGEWVPVKDHYPTRQADEMLLNHFMKRMETEHPNIEVEVKKDRLCVRRRNKTYKELVLEECTKRQEEKDENSHKTLV